MSSTSFLDQVEPVSKKDRTLAILREAIITGKIDPGAPIAENRVSQRLGVAQGLVREALIELEHQGLVQRMPYRGTFVTKLSREDIEKIFRLRSELEALAGKWAKAQAKAADIAALRGLVEGMRQGAEKLDLDQFYKNDLAFHRKLWAVSGNEYLVDALERVVVPLFAFFLMKSTRLHESYIESVTIHERIIDALETKDAESVQQLIRETLSELKEEWFTKLLPKEA